MSTSSSSPTYPTTQREHSVHCCEELQSGGLDTSPRVIASQISSARVSNTSHIKHNVREEAQRKCYNSRNVWDGRTRTWRYWSNWSAVTKRSSWQQSNAIDTTIDSTRNTCDRHEELVASDSISWRQGKFSWLELVLLDCGASNQQTTCGKTQEIWRQHESGFPKPQLSNEDLELTDQAYTLSALLCKDEACAYVRSAEDENGYHAWQAPFRARTARKATNFLNQWHEG